MLRTALACLMIGSLSANLLGADKLPRTLFKFTSSADGTTQAAYLLLPKNLDRSQPVPLIVHLHSWSAGFEQRNPTLERLAQDRGWAMVSPNFRGPNRTPQACGSKLAQQDILDALDWVLQHHAVDAKRVYLTGNSGGGHMTMLMAGRHPQRWRAASAWVGISDLKTWHQKHQGTKYGNMMEACCGGPPGKSAAVDAEYTARSPITHMAAAKEVAIDIAAGDRDGHTGSVPIRHSIDAFNKIAEAARAEPVSETEITQLSRAGGRLQKPQPGDVGFDPTFDRKFYLRRRAGNARITIFDGGHEGIATAAIAWFEKHP